MNDLMSSEPVIGAARVMSHPAVEAASSVSKLASGPMGAANVMIMGFDKHNDLPLPLQKMASFFVPDQDYSLGSQIMNNTPLISAAKKDGREKAQGLELAKTMVEKYPEMPGFRYETITVEDKNYGVAAIWAPTERDPDRVFLYSDLHNGDITRHSGINNPDVADAITQCKQDIGNALRHSIREETASIDQNDFYEKADALHQSWIQQTSPLPADAPKQRRTQANTCG